MRSESKKLEKIRKELFIVFSSFIDNPENEEIKEKAKKMDEEYSGALSYARHSSKEIFPPFIIEAMGNISLIYEYGLYGEDHPAFSNEKIKEKVKEIIEKLK